MKESVATEQMTPAGRSRSRVKAWFRSWLSSEKRSSWFYRGKSTAAAVGALREPEEMQRCPYLHEMKERLLSQPTPTDSLDMERLDGSGGTPVKDHHHASSQHHHHKANSDYPAHNNPGVIPEPPEMPPDSLIGTVVKQHGLFILTLQLNSDGYGSHTSPAHARQPLVPQNSNNQPLCLTPTHSAPMHYNPNLPKNAK
ncbi:hypothetical protein TSAR_008872 [Trichomalopsis sarcophagae]|uniref:Uncharacterized protein n=1 Tax=Trichomalopsis sarcophagae TaxID=543379 RepID=A0A232EPZ6_9HYME|nr:hypothetical protein TSAR_008872 [Trichomalopsis sarcophagae]